MTTSKTQTKIWTVNEGKLRSHSDYIAAETPLQIRLVTPDFTHNLAITMRTPGHDFDLVTGFLFSEGIIKQKTDILGMSHCIKSEVERENRYNIVNVKLNDENISDLTTLNRHFYTNSACGVCGKTSIESLKVRGVNPMASNLLINVEIIYNMPEKLRSQQKLFSSTGGLHAAGLFDHQGNLIYLREDVGRHNAVDKIIGAALLSDILPLNEHIIMVSGRLSFEIVQKCIVAGVGIICAVSAPSSLAVELAQEYNMTLIGFLRDRKFNIYSGLHRLEM